MGWITYVQQHLPDNMFPGQVLVVKGVKVYMCCLVSDIGSIGKPVYLPTCPTIEYRAVNARSVSNSSGNTAWKISSVQQEQVRIRTYRTDATHSLAVQ